MVFRPIASNGSLCYVTVKRMASNTCCQQNPPLNRWTDNINRVRLVSSLTNISNRIRSMRPPFCHPERSEGSTRSDSPASSLFKQAVAVTLHVLLASRRRPSAAALNEVKGLGITSSLACGSGRRKKSAASALLGMTQNGLPELTFRYSWL
jgi:hypothetical protein